MPRSAVASVCLGLLLTLGSTRTKAELRARSAPEHVDGVAAFVGGTAPGEGVMVILHSDVELRARLSLLSAGAAAPAHVPLPGQLLKVTLDELLGEALIAIEATRLGLSAPSQSELLAARQGLLSASTGEQSFRGLLGALGVSSSELDEVARRRAVVGAFLAANLEGTLTPSDAELLRAYQTEQHPFRDEPLAEVRDRLSAWLSQKRLHEAVGRWVLSLKDRTPHRVLAVFGS